MHKTYGTWTLLKHDGNHVIIQCSCGKTRKTLTTTWIYKLHMSKSCRTCRENHERARLTRMFNPKLKGT